MVAVLNSMVASSIPMMAELRKLQIPLKFLGLKMETLLIPSEFNHFANSLSLNLDPGDFRATETMVE